MKLDAMIEQLAALDSQFVHDRENVFGQMANCANEAREALIQINRALSVDAAEYVPAIRDVFEILDMLAIDEINKVDF